MGDLLLKTLVIADDYIKCRIAHPRNRPDTLARMWIKRDSTLEATTTDLGLRF